MPKKKSAKRKGRRTAPPNGGTQSRSDRLTISKAELVEMFGGQITLVQRMLEASRSGEDVWLEIVGNKRGKGGARTVIDRASARRAYRRMLAGEVPPLMRSERQRQTKEPAMQLAQPKGTPTKCGLALMQAFDLLPKGAAQVVIHPQKKTLTISWANGDYEHCTIRSARGQRRRLSSVRFKPSTNAPLPPPREPEEP